jgi:tetratricopeptide (TPR) repeat protein
MKTKLLFLLVLITSICFSQTDKNVESKTISGAVSFENKRLSNVSIFIAGTIKYTVTDSKGLFSLKAKPGEVLTFSYIGLKTIPILIEDVTSVLNINMKVTNSVAEFKTNKVLKLGGSTIGANGLNFFVKRIAGDSLNTNAGSLTKAIEEKIPELFLKFNDFGEEIIFLRGQELNGPVLWIFDGFVFDIPIPVFISEVKDLTVMNSKASGFIIKVNTSLNYKKVKDIIFEDYYFTDEDYYKFDATLYRKLKTSKPLYLKEYKKKSKSEEAFNTYVSQHSVHKNTINYHLNVFNYLKKEKFGKTILLKVLSDFEKLSINNPENLKAIAYKYQQLNENKKALEVYKKIINLRPKYRQSYRDLANTFLTLKKYRDVWLTYNYYLNKNFKIEENDIGEIIASEIISSYNLDQEERGVHQKIKIKNPKKNIKSDVRLVFEWNTSEAEFIIEFINPNLQAYKIENSIDKNNDLIVDQKKKGYTSKEIFINTLKRGNYYVNLTYLGNKQHKPTVFKITTYYNWGRPNQTKKIDVFDFTLQNIKTKLLKLNRKNI